MKQNKMLYRQISICDYSTAGVAGHRYWTIKFHTCPFVTLHVNTMPDSLLMLRSPVTPHQSSRPINNFIKKGSKAIKNYVAFTSYQLYCEVNFFLRFTANDSSYTHQ